VKACDRTVCNSIAQHIRLLTKLTSTNKMQLHYCNARARTKQEQCRYITRFLVNSCRCRVKSMPLFMTMNVTIR